MSEQVCRDKRVQEGEELSPCPSCGRLIEKVDVCYYCCAATAPSRRVSEKRLMLWGVAAVVLGIAIIGWAAMTETRIIPIAELSELGDFQTARIVGTVAEVRLNQGPHYPEPGPYRESDIFWFHVEDASSRLANKKPIGVKVEGALYWELVKADKVPREGDEVDVVGSHYRPEAEFEMLGLNNPDMLSVTRMGGR